MMNFPNGTNRKLITLGVPILKHIMVHVCSRKKIKINVCSRKCLLSILHVIPVITNLKLAFNSLTGFAFLCNEKL